MIKVDSKPPITGTKDPIPFPHIIIGRSADSVESFENHIVAFKRNSGYKDTVVHSEKIHCIAWSRDGRYLATGSYDKTIVLWSLRDQKLTREFSLKGHSHSVEQLAWHPTNPDQLLSLSADKTVKIWSLKQRTALHAFGLQSEAITICWAPDGQSFVVGDKEDRITFIHVENNKRVERRFKYEVNEMLFREHNGKTLFFLAGEGEKAHDGRLEYYEYDFPELKHINTIIVSAQPLVAVEMDPAGQYFAIGGSDSNITLWKIDGLYPFQEITRHKTVVRTVSFSHDSLFLASVTGDDGYIDVSLVETGEKVWSYQNEDRDKDSFSLVAAHFHPKKHLLACAYDCKERDRHKDAAIVRIFGFPSPPESEKDKKKETRDSRDRARSRERERDRERDTTPLHKDDTKTAQPENAKPKFESRFSLLRPSAEQVDALEKRKVAQAAADAKAKAAAAGKAATRISLKPGSAGSDTESISRIRQPIRAPEEPARSSKTESSSNQRGNDSAPSQRSNGNGQTTSNGQRKTESNKSRPSSASRKPEREESSSDRKRPRSPNRERESESRSRGNSSRPESKK